MPSIGAVTLPPFFGEGVTAMTFLKKLFAVAITAGAAAYIASPAVAQAATLHVSPGGSGGSCSAASPCGSFDAAYRAARPGDTVEVAGGSYGRQEIPALGRSAPRIEFRPASGAP